MLLEFCAVLGQEGRPQQHPWLSERGQRHMAASARQLLVFAWQARLPLMAQLLLDLLLLELPELQREVQQAVAAARAAGGGGAAAQQHHLRGNGEGSSSGRWGGRGSSSRRASDSGEGAGSSRSALAQGPAAAAAGARAGVGLLGSHTLLLAVLAALAAVLAAAGRGTGLSRAAELADWVVGLGCGATVVMLAWQRAWPPQPAAASGAQRAPHGLWALLGDALLGSAVPDRDPAPSAPALAAAGRDAKLLLGASGAAMGVWLLTCLCAPSAARKIVAVWHAAAVAAGLAAAIRQRKRQYAACERPHRAYCLVLLALALCGVLASLRLQLVLLMLVLMHAGVAGGRRGMLLAVLLTAEVLQALVQCMARRQALALEVGSRLAALLAVHLLAGCLVGEHAKRSS
jgi:hypothetical protein